MWFVMIIFVTQCSCSKQPLRIYGGIDAKPDEYSYVVRIEIQRYFRNKNNSISYHHDHLCTASALSPIWVLSAAHCTENPDVHYYGSPYNVEKLVIRHGRVEHLPGIHDSFSDVLYTVSNPLYTYAKADLLKNDISLLKTFPMNIKNYIKLSAVDYKCFYGHKAILAGFGITTKILPDGTTETEDTLVLKKPLQVLEVLITKCNPAEKLIALCLVSRCGHASSSCGGDSGGPLLHSSGVIGVLSQGPPSGFCLDSYEKETDNIIGYVIPVTPYIEWIYHITKKKIR